MKFKYLFLILFILLCVILIVVILMPPPQISGNAINEQGGDIQVYFCPDDMCKEKLLSLIGTSSEIKCAFYELNLKDVIAALEDKGAQVVIEDSTYKNTSHFMTGYSFALMHNKFCIFDRKTILTGSMNPTVNDNFYNNNNIVIIDSVALAENYIGEFEELKGNVYGKGNAVKHPVVYLGDTMVENYFCPEDNCKLHVINALKQANRSVYFMTFSFTDKDIGNLLWNKEHLGLDVKGIFEEQQLSEFSTYDDLKDFSIIDRNSRKLHHKVFIIDNETVVTGSFNPTQNANEANDENVIIIHNREVAEKYAREFTSLYYAEPRLPDRPEGIALSQISFNPLGKDEGNEYAEITSMSDREINLEYYYLSDNKTSMQLSGKLLPHQKTRIKPKFSLRNKDGLLLLKHNDDILDFAVWGSSIEGEFLKRIDFSATDTQAWEKNAP